MIGRISKRSRIGRTGSTPAYPFPLLSEREREVLDLLVAGRLRLSPR